MRRSSSLFLSLSGALALTVAVPSSASAQAVRVEVETTAVMPPGERGAGGDLARTRAQALSEALAQAIEDAAGQSAPELAGRLYLVKGRARDYVLSYRILEEGESQGQFRLRVQCEVDLPRLVRDLSGAPGPVRAPGPRLRICGAPPADVLAELRTAIGTRAAVESASATDCASAESGTTPTLFYATTHTVAAEPIRGTLPELYGAEATVELRALRSPENQVSESATAPAFADSGPEASRQAVLAATRAALGRLLARPFVLPGGSSGVTVSLEGLSGYQRYQRVLRVLSSLPGVSRVEPRRFVPPTRAGLPPPSGALAPGERDDLTQVFLSTAETPQVIGAALARAPLGELRLQVSPTPTGELRVLCTSESALPDATAPTDAAPPEPPTPDPAADKIGGAAP